MQKEHPDIARWKKLAEQSLEWGPSLDWNDYDFERLSERIFARTDVRLSISTLKRIWGKVRYESSPNTATLNALARFLECEDWRDFQQKNTRPPTAQAEGAPPPSTEIPPAARPAATLGLHRESRRRRKNFRAPVLILAVAILISLSLVFLSGKRDGRKEKPLTTELAGITTSPAPPDSKTIKFESRKASDDLPNSVVFEYDASAFHSDHVYIQQNWDSARREKVPGDGHYHTSIYYRPGFFRAKLIVDGQIKKENDVFIRTKGWVGIIDVKPVPVYLNSAEIRQKAVLGVTGGTLIQKTGASIFQDQWTSFSNVREFKGLDSTDFTMAITLRNSSSREQAPCRRINIYILGTQSAIIIPLADKGCISELKLLTGDGWISGKENDLSGFGCDFHSFQHLECQVKDQRLKILLHNKLILDTSEHQTIGAIIGIRIGFEGAGEMRDIRLDSHGIPIYQESF